MFLSKIVVFQAGESTNDIYFCDQGELEIFLIDNMKNNTQVLHTLAQGSVVG